MLAKYSTYFACTITKCMCTEDHQIHINFHVHIWCDVNSFGFLMTISLDAIDTLRARASTCLLCVLTCVDHTLSTPTPFHPLYAFCSFVQKWMSIESFNPHHATNNLTPSYKSSILSLAIKSHFVIHLNECNFINFVWLNV